MGVPSADEVVAGVETVELVHLGSSYQGHDRHGFKEVEGDRAYFEGGLMHQVLSGSALIRELSTAMSKITVLE